MTEAEWLACAEPRRMLEHLRRKARHRKLRLFACACCRRAWHRITHPFSREAVEVAERYADRQVKDVDRERVTQAMRVLCGPGCSAAYSTPFHVVRSTRLTFIDGIIAAEHAVFAVTGVRNRGDNPAAEDGERAAQAELLRDVFGNPFRPVVLDTALWPSTVVQLAAAIYEERAFDRLPILADALEESGCTDAAILDHLRSPGPHVRGCWVVDLLLDNE
jgi:hypothetical protein